MKLSVVTVCYNAEKTIGYSIESFLRQNYPDKELVIVDGASTDKTMQIVESFGSIHIRSISENDQGLYDAMNKGLALFSGDAIGFLNADDCYHDDLVLSDIAEALEKSDIVFGNLDFVSDQISRRVVRRWRGSEYQPGSFKRGWMAAHPTFYIRREVASTVGTFDIDLKIAADYDYMLRAFELHEFRVRFIDRVLADMMVGGRSTAGMSAYLKGNLECLKSRQRWLGAGAVDIAFAAKPLRKIGQFA